MYSLSCWNLLKVRQIRNDFFNPTFLPKNERTNSTLLLVDLFSFVFWKKVKTPKSHFEIKWPLDIKVIWHLRTFKQTIKKCLHLTFRFNFQCKKNQRNFVLFSIEEHRFGRPFLLIKLFSHSNFQTFYFLKLCPIFVDSALGLLGSRTMYSLKCCLPWNVASLKQMDIITP